MNIPEDIAEVYFHKLIDIGVWRVNSGIIERTIDGLNLGDLSVSDYLAMCVDVISRLTETGPCRYESYMVGTTQKLKREFYKKIDSAFRELIEQSENAEQDCILAWNYSALDCTKTLRIKQESI